MIPTQQALRLTLCLVFLLVEAGIVSAQFVSPIGIPAPAFGITETAPTRPSPWTSDQAGYGYVNASVSCSDTPTWGNPTAPRCTIPQNLAAGEVWELHGTYATSHSGAGTQFRATGTAESPVWIRGQDCASLRPTVTNRWEITGTYFIVECIISAATAGGKYQFDLTGDTLGGTSHHLALRNSAITGNDLNGGLTTGGAVHNVVFYDNEEGDIGDYDVSLGIPDQDFHGISIGCCAHDVWVLDSSMTRTSGDCVQVNAGSLANTSLVYNIWIGRNTGIQCRQNGFWSKYAGNVIMSQNVAGIFTPAAGSSEAACYGAQYGTQALWIMFNSCVSADHAVIIASDDGGQGVTNTFILGNIFGNIQDTNGDWDIADYDNDAVILLRTRQNVYIITNTIFTSSVSGVAIPGGATGSLYAVFGNIFSNVSGRSFIVETAANAAAISAGANVFAPYYDQNIEGAVQTVNPDTTFGGNNLVRATAGFLSDGNFRLADSSAARDIDINNNIPGVYSTYALNYGVNIAMSFNGSARPTGFFDAGAYEWFQGSVVRLRRR